MGTRGAPLSLTSPLSRHRVTVTAHGSRHDACTPRVSDSAPGRSIMIYSAVPRYTGACVYTGVRPMRCAEAAPITHKHNRCFCDDPFHTPSRSIPEKTALSREPLASSPRSCGVWVVEVGRGPCAVGPNATRTHSGAVHDARPHADARRKAPDDEPAVLTPTRVVVAPRRRPVPARFGAVDSRAPPPQLPTARTSLSRIGHTCLFACRR